MPQKILVTGASGFIATHCILELLEHGYHVRGTVRDLARAPRLKNLLAQHTEHADALDFAQVDLLKPEGWPEAAEGCDGLFHIASPVPIAQPKNAEEVVRPAREGTLNALRAAQEQGIERVVMTSSIAAVAFGNEHQTQHVNEQDWTNLEAPNLSPYFRSKTVAERCAWEFVENTNIQLTSINPGIVFGPALESDYGSSLQFLIDLYTGKFPLIPKIGFEAVDVRDVASLHRIACESPAAAGKRLLCTNGFVWHKDIAEMIKANFPKNNCPRFMMPNLLLNLLAPFIEELGMVRGETDKVKTADNSTAMQLGWKPRSVEEAVIAGTRSLIELGLVPG